MEKLSSNQILAASSLWVAAALNLFPGLGTGYIYQRRWKAYWFTGVATLLWLTLVRLSNGDTSPLALSQIQPDQFGAYGLLLISAFTSCEAGIAVRMLRKKI